MPNVSRAVLVTVGLMLSAAPVRAQLFHDDEDGWCLWCFHDYGGDVNRPGATPDRPYWHGDDAVPLGLRWQDLDAARARFAAEDVAAAAVAAETLPPPPRAARRHRVRVARRSLGPVLVRKD